VIIKEKEKKKKKTQRIKKEKMCRGRGIFVFFCGLFATELLTEDRDFFTD
jgi:hypothetical protein